MARRGRCRYRSTQRAAMYARLGSSLVVRPSRPPVSHRPSTGQNAHGCFVRLYVGASVTFAQASVRPAPYDPIHTPVLCFVSMYQQQESRHVEGEPHHAAASTCSATSVLLFGIKGENREAEERCLRHYTGEQQRRYPSPTAYSKKIPQIARIPLCAAKARYLLNVCDVRKVHVTENGAREMASVRQARKERHARLCGTAATTAPVAEECVFQTAATCVLRSACSVLVCGRQVVGGVLQRRRNARARRCAQLF